MNDIKINSNVTATLEQSKKKTEARELDKFASKFDEVLKTKDRAELEKVASDFEELFVNIIMKNMRSTIMESELSKASYQREVFQGMLDEKYSKEIAKTGSFGISKIIVNSFERYLKTEDESEINSPSIDIKG